MLKHNNNLPSSPSRVVILGAKGFVGSMTKNSILHEGISVLALGREELDLLAPDALEKLSNILLPTDSLVIVSAEVPAKNNGQLERNIKMMSVICSVLEKITPSHIIYVSSDAVYADSNEALTEESCAQPESIHGIMHVTREVMLKNAYSGALCILRPTIIYGIEDPHNSYGPNQFRRLVAKNENIVLFGEGEERRDFILVDDVSKLILLALLHKSEGVLNLATGTVYSFRDVADLVLSHFKNKTEIISVPRSGPMPHNGYRPFSADSTYNAFPDFKYIDLKEGLLKTHLNMMEKNDGRS